MTPSLQNSLRWLGRLVFIGWMALWSASCIDKVERVCESNASCLTEDETVCYLGRCRPQLCQLGESRVCYPDKAETKGVGTCRDGVQICQNNGSAWSPCFGASLPQPEACDGLDNDCDGQTDEGLDCQCQPRTTRRCYTGPTQEPAAGTPCVAGIQYCGKEKTWGPCQQQLPPGEALRQALRDPTQRATAIKQIKDCQHTDRNCDGKLDEGLDCPCKLGESRECYTGPTGTKDKGTCKAGTQSCIKNAAGRNQWGFCEKQVLPKPEENEGCNDKDDDCDGIIDNQSETKAPLWKSCGTGCRLQLCQKGTWSICQQVEICQNQLDDNCDGTTDEPGCVSQ